MSYQSINPANGIVANVYSYLDSDQLTERINRTQNAFQQWRQLSFHQRGQFFKQLALLLRRNVEALEQSMHKEMGKLADECQAEIFKAADACVYYAEHAEQLLAAEKIKTDYRLSIVQYQPLGVVLGIMPWNFPIWQIIRFIAPTMMAGNICLVKPAENVPATSLLLENLIQQAGFPVDSYQNLFISNTQCKTVIASDLIQAVSLTGSVSAGKSVAASAGEFLKKSVMELGGSDAFIVCDDANIEEAAKAAIVSRFSNAGQTCIAAKRFIVSAGIADEFVHQLKQATENLNAIAPLAKSHLRQQLQHQIQASIQQGARVVCGCHIDNSYAYYPPSILDHVKKGMPAYSEELFGPVISIIRVNSLNEAAFVANDTQFGLAASIWTSNEPQAQREAQTLADQLQCGAVFINSLVKSDVRLPFGGCKKSGFGREMGQLGIREFTNAKTLAMA